MTEETHNYLPENVNPTTSGQYPWVPLWDNSLAYEQQVSVLILQVLPLSVFLASLIHEMEYRVIKATYQCFLFNDRFK